MTNREKLIELINAAADLCPCELEVIADHLIASGVKVVGAETDLSGKCGSCAFAKPTRLCGSNCYVECTNEDHLSRRTKRYAEAKRPRTVKACKNYVPKPPEEE